MCNRGSETHGAGESGLTPHRFHLLLGPVRPCPQALAAAQIMEDRDSRLCLPVAGWMAEHTGRAQMGVEKQQLCLRQQELKGSHLSPCLWLSEAPLVVLAGVGHCPDLGSPRQGLRFTYLGSVMN